MSEKDLMIGDNVIFASEVQKVLTIDSDGLVLLDGCDDLIPIGLLEPITITPEILEKNGFEFNHRGAYVYGEVVRIYFFSNDIIDNTVISIGDTYVDIEIKYIHELQHALRLCNIDKDIEL